MENRTKYPVDNETYDLMQAFVSKCESIEAYEKYKRDGKAEFFDKLIEDEKRHANELLKHLKQALQRF